MSRGKRRERPRDEMTWEERERAFRNARAVDLGRKGNVTVPQIAERLRMDEGYVARLLREAGVTPKPVPKPLRVGKMKAHAE